MAFKWLKKQFRKVIQWENPAPDAIVWKYPLERKEEIMRNSQLVVREGQRAMFIKEGKLADVFGPGTYELSDIKNIPILTSLYNWKFAWESPYTGDVYFVSTKQFINNKWGTANPIMMRDKEFDMIRIRGYGTYSFAVAQPKNAMQQLFGSQDILTVRNVDEYFKKIITSILSTVIAESGYVALELVEHYDTLSEMAKIKMTQHFEELGIEIKGLFIENLSLPEEVEKILDKRTSLGVIGGKMQGYAQMESIGAMRDAAKNPSGIAGVGVGVGAGVGIGQMFGQTMSGINLSQSNNDSNKNQPNNMQDKTIKCKKCGANVKEDAKFCPECGNNMNPKVECNNCGAKVDEGIKFCPECGIKIGTKTCKTCGVEVKNDAKFCPECGEKM